MIKASLKYAWYVARHKFYVARACFREGLYWRGITHDLSKLRPSEFIPYARFFYGPKKHGAAQVGANGYMKPNDSGDHAFDVAWLKHQKLNAHHWQWWLLPLDNGGTKTLPMPHADRLEMICDWKGAGLAQGKPDTAAWYRDNKDKMQLHQETREWVEKALGVES